MNLEELVNAQHELESLLSENKNLKEENSKYKLIFNEIIDIVDRETLYQSKRCFIKFMILQLM